MQIGPAFLYTLQQQRRLRRAGLLSDRPSPGLEPSALLLTWRGSRLNGCPPIERARTSGTVEVQRKKNRQMLILRSAPTNKKGHRFGTPSVGFDSVSTSELELGPDEVRAPKHVVVTWHRIQGLGS